ncbi:MAG: NAD(P)-dependent glycerol-3-phosphate dehydrogenase [Acidobacteria bacterium]|nr:NAD(P)-dependent glycerol-3-phosphate dehydrogenase [Acidobacteriota bacterium]MBI3658677.1 NAD(P)-dependent glycerol-3-phosphate dehydrogenase [Acidobacteriota bacterium]
MKRIAVIGAGSWGTALAIILDRLEHQVRLWVRRPELAATIRRQRENTEYLPSCPIPESVFVSSEPEAVLHEAEIVLSVMPSHTVRAVFTVMKPYLKRDMVFVSATKGIENDSLMRMTQVIGDVLGSPPPALAVLSGPAFALEVVSGDPTAIVLASEDDATSHMLQRELYGRNLRTYTNRDVIGVEIGGAVKNVIAIAAGVVRGLGFGSNTLAGLITRGLTEITRLVTALGGKAETMAGLAGLGDLVLTCTAQLSRNRSVGVQLGQGKALSEIVGPMRMVAEGVRTTKSTLNLAGRAGVEMPITEQMYSILFEGKSPSLALRSLMERELKGE